ncbi:MAG: hypothetical protein LBL55_09425, partial [Propionibacteriaceae bacterium]|nr:hypothetical protein [Propionibacteriaceae bacterium]
MKRRLIFSVVAVAVAASLVVTPAMAAQTPEEIDQSVATYDQLVEIVNSRVEDAYSSVNGTIESLVAETVKATIGNPQAILELATPLIKSTAKGLIAQYIQDERLDALIDSAVDAVAQSQLIDAILTNEFVLAVIDRTVDYAVADIVAALGLAADQQATTDSIVNQVWNAPLVSVGTAPTRVKSNLGSPIYALGVGVNSSYYNYNVTAWNQKRVVIVNVNDTPREITVTGWNSGNIGLLASGTAVVNAAGKADSVVTTLSNLDYVSILIDAGWRALQDEIQFRIEAAILAAKTALLQRLQDGLAGIGVTVTLDPASAWTDISAQIAAALRATGQEALQEALAQLPWVATPGTPDESFFAALSRVAGDGARYLVNWFLNIDWLRLFRGGETGSAKPTLSIKIDRKAMTNTDNPVITVDARDSFGNQSPAFAVSFSYGDSCQFPTGQEPSRRTCLVTATFGELTAKAQVEVFDPSALAAPVQGLAVPGETLKASPPAGWPTTTRAWTRNGTKFSTASSYKLPSTEKIGNVIELTTSLTYQGLTISASSPALTVGVGAPATLTITPKAK